MKKEMKKIETSKAVGMVLSHDITEIVPGKFKGRAFKKGHVIREEDVEKLKSLGKEHIYIIEIDETEMHENDAAMILAEIGKGENVYIADEIKEGKIDFFSNVDGLLKINKKKLFELNMMGQMSFATLTENIPVRKGEKLAGARVIPLIIEKEKMARAKELIDEKLVDVKPFRKMKVGVVTTGSEIYNGRIEDKFGPVIRDKVGAYGCEVIHQEIVPDDMEKIVEAGRKLLDMGAEMLIFTGGMSVDPDDMTPTAIGKLGGELVSYGSPVLPGSMFLLSYLGDLPIMGLPGCVMYSKKTMFDLALPRILAGEKLTMEDIMNYGHGGLCQSCEVCTFPNCTFGK